MNKRFRWVSIMKNGGHKFCDTIPLTLINVASQPLPKAELVGDFSLPSVVPSSPTNTDPRLVGEKTPTDISPGLGTPFFSVQNVPFLFRSKKRTLHSFPFFS